MARHRPPCAGATPCIALCALLLWLAAYSAEPGTQQHATQGDDTASLEAETRPASDHRQVRRFLPFDPQWRPESSVPKKPQEQPGMVIWEVSRFSPDTPASDAQRQAADEFRERCYQAAVRNGWLDFQKALADGYKLQWKDRRHYANWDFMQDGRVLDPDRPEFLMYYGTPQGKQLAGFMFYPDSRRARGPQIGGPLTIWHWHVWNQKGCMVEGLLTVGVASDDGSCERGEPTQRSPEMMHVWLIDRRAGPFATSMSIEPSEFQRLAAKRREQRGEPW